MAFRNCMDIMSMNGKEITTGKKSAAFSFLSPQVGHETQRFVEKEAFGDGNRQSETNAAVNVSKKYENNPTGKQPIFCSDELSVLQAVLGELTQKS